MRCERGFRAFENETVAPRRLGVSRIGDERTRSVLLPGGIYRIEIGACVSCIYGRVQPSMGKCGVFNFGERSETARELQRSILDYTHPFTNLYLYREACFTVLCVTIILVLHSNMYWKIISENRCSVCANFRSMGWSLDSVHHVAIFYCTSDKKNEKSARKLETIFTHLLVGRIVWNLSLLKRFLIDHVNENL